MASTFPSHSQPRCSLQMKPRVRFTVLTILVLGFTAESSSAQSLHSPWISIGAGMSSASLKAQASSSSSSFQFSQGISDDASGYLMDAGIGLQVGEHWLAGFRYQRLVIDASSNPFLFNIEYDLPADVYSLMLAREVSRVGSGFFAVELNTGLLVGQGEVSYGQGGESVTTTAADIDGNSFLGSVELMFSYPALKALSVEAGIGFRYSKLTVESERELESGTVTATKNEVDYTGPAANLRLRYSFGSGS